MVEPISTVTVATAATASTAATTGTATTVTATTAQAASIKANALRLLANAMLDRSEILVLNESEIVDEFAVPIYTGLAAATTSGTGAKTNSNPKAGTIAFPTAGTTSIDGPLKPAQEDKLKASDSAQPAIESGADVEAGKTSVASPEPNIPNMVLSSEKPEIQYLLDKHYPAPSIQAQLQTDASQIVVERSLIDDKVVIEGNKKTAICLIEERVVDRKYLEYGHLSDVISEIRHGNIPTIHQIYLAMIDLTDMATFKMFRPALLKYKLEDAKVRLRQISADLEKKQLAPELAKTTPDSWKIDRKVDKRSWYKTDHVTERIGHQDITVEKTYDMVALNVRDVCTIKFSKPELDALLAQRNKFINLIGAGDQVNRIENYFTPEQISSINKSAMAWTQETILTTTSEYTTDHEFHRYWGDLNGFLGTKETTSNKKITTSATTMYSEYLSESDNINLANIKSFDEARHKFAQLQKTTSMTSDSKLLAQYTKPSTGTQFNDGWITYIPGGSIANLGAKADLGEKLNGWDYFWAGVDVATIAVAVVTLGTSSIATAAGKTAATVGEKAVVKVGASTLGKVALKNGVKAGEKAVAKIGAKTAGKLATKTGVQTVAKKTGKVFLKNTGQKAGAKAVARTAGKIVPKTGLKPNASYIKNGFTYITDKQGRVIKATGKLKKVPGIRSSQNQRLAAQMGKLGDEGGHLIPVNYGGPGSLINHVPQTRNVNRSVIKRIENEMGRALKAGKKVEYTVMPHYPDASISRPDKFTIRYKIDGIQHIRRIKNV